MSWSILWNIEDSDGAHTGNRTERISNVWAGQFANTDFVIKHNGDTNGDGTEDLIWYRASNGTVNVWEMQNNTQSQVKNILPSSDISYELVPKNHPQ